MTVKPATEHDGNIIAEVQVAPQERNRLFSGEFWGIFQTAQSPAFLVLPGGACATHTYLLSVARPSGDLVLL
jgi:hypothetical protein